MGLGVKKKINILHVIESSETGGAESVYLRLVSELDKRKFVSYTCLFKPGWLERQLVDAGVEPTVMKTTSSFDVKLLLSMISLVKNNNIDLIHSHLFGANVYSSVVGKLMGLPVISTFHGMVDISSSERFLRLKVSLVNHFSKKIVFVSQQLRKTMCHQWGIKDATADVIHNGVDLRKFTPASSHGDCNFIREEYGWEKDDSIILSIGDIRPPKGYDTLLQVASCMVGDNPQIRFLIAGSLTSLYEEYKKYIVKNQLIDNVIFLGFRDDVKELMACADVFYLPSTSEGFSIATIEAMAMGIPVVATRSGGPEEIITHGKDGLLIPVGSKENAIKSLNEVLRNSNLRRSLSAHGCKTVERNFSIDRMISLYEKVYFSLLS